MLPRVRLTQGNLFCLNTERAKKDLILFVV